MSARSRDLPRRSCLSVPGSSEKMLAKGPTIPADMTFLDLEDAVAPLEKEAARSKVVNAIKTLDWGDRVLCVRVNAWDTEWTYGDVIEVVSNAGSRLDEIMLPKVNTAAEVVALDLLLTHDGDGLHGHRGPAGYGHHVGPGLRGARSGDVHSGRRPFHRVRPRIVGRRHGHRVLSGRKHRGLVGRALRRYARAFALARPLALAVAIAFGFVFRSGSDLGGIQRRLGAPAGGAGRFPGLGLRPLQLLADLVEGLPHYPVRLQ